MRMVRQASLEEAFPRATFAVTAAYHDDTAPIADFTDSQGGLTQHVVRPAAPAPPAPPPSAPPPTAQPPTAQAAIVSLLGGGHAKATAKGRKISVDPGEQAICPPAGPACSALVDATTQTAGKATSARRNPKRKTIAVGRAAKTIAAGATARITFTLNGRGAKLLRANKRLRLQLTTTARAGNGAPTTLKSTTTIRLPKPTNR